jgi:hypothetical protein
MRCGASAASAEGSWRRGHLLDERFVLRLDAHDKELHRLIAVVHAAMDDVWGEIIGLARLDLIRLLALALEGGGPFEDVGNLMRIGVDVPGQDCP